MRHEGRGAGWKASWGAVGCVGCAVARAVTGPGRGKPRPGRCGLWCARGGKAGWRGLREGVVRAGPG
ncbi:hypothetical protein DMH18_26165 [Streptomyces sp. WAC 06783]|nr:hypothetical protein DMH18_26165 [Streptomyces sp. WAC 06783]